MNIQSCYKLLDVPENASNEAVAASFKKLAHKYHPDKNRERTEWANEVMTKLNLAYSAIMSHRFQQGMENGKKSDSVQKEETPQKPREKRHTKPGKTRIEEEYLIQSFIRLRENTKESLYKFFQFSLYNLARREMVSNRGTYNNIVHSLRKSYHGIGKLIKQTDDDELLEHFNTFKNMIFNFYRAAECLNIIDSYTSQYEVNAYRSYKRGDDALHLAHKELFFDRHNRGKFDQDKVLPRLAEAELIFQRTILNFPKSGWLVETAIKLEYVQSLKNYIQVFFNE
ncbi:MAG: hypothetical protein CVV44_01000 [Spirochaetae bacterium HGW-Spirochaetae-1]|jgi:curved DNA-binding protein CbpA|nr:MAG: hypothetical protein CVV44_01000 [Spirochaetae bacterium HGW-Spirochaetae-1]